MNRVAILESMLRGKENHSMRSDYNKWVKLSIDHSKKMLNKEMKAGNIAKMLVEFQERKLFSKGIKLFFLIL